jgi:tRNA (guanine37-N1)-methyltransferase
MDFHILTIFPDWFSSPLKQSIIKRAADRGIIRIFIHNIRDFASDRHRTVDDVPYGGGAGMVMKADVLARAIEHVKNSFSIDSSVLLSPSGNKFNQNAVQRLSEKKSVLLVCGNYEGIDERLIKGGFVDTEVSIGDYILTGGEIAAFAVMDSVVRLLPDALGNKESISEESFISGLLEYPQYTRPRDFRGMRVPQVLLSGDHEKIRKWRRKESLLKTFERRPDLLKKKNLAEEDLKLLEWKSLDKKKEYGIFIALIHHPVLNRHRDVVTTAVTTVDIHDIARAARTYGARKLFIVTPVRAQQELVRRVISHWVSEYGDRADHPRKEAMLLVEITDSFDSVRKRVFELTGSRGLCVATGAGFRENAADFSTLKNVVNRNSFPVTLLLGTGWGLAPEIIEQSDFRLEAIAGSSDYNHLSVRSAASIILDRLLGS